MDLKKIEKEKNNILKKEAPKNAPEAASKPSREEGYRRATFIVQERLLDLFNLWCESNGYSKKFAINKLLYDALSGKTKEVDRMRAQKKENDKISNFDF